MLLVEYLHAILSCIKQSETRKFVLQSLKFGNKTGLEIGGPSHAFQSKGFLPVYPFAKRVDAVNYSHQTVWEGSITEGYTYHYYKNKTGYQYVDEASNLSKIQDAKYDFILSSHSLEHVANPIKTLLEWKRVLQPKGKLLIIVPNKLGTFDHKREYTTFEHLISDYKNNVGEDDNTHFDEVFRLHDISKDAGVKSLQEFKERTLENYKNRCIHHHVFSLQLMQQLLDFCSFDVVFQKDLENFHLVTIARLKRTK